MKILLLSVMTMASLWAVNATIVNGDVDVQINGQKVKHVKKGETFTLQEKQKICLLKKVGDGAVKIVYPTNFTVKLKKIHECETVPKQVEVEKQGLIEGIVASLFKKSQDSSQDGVGSKGGEEEVYAKDINLEEVKRTMNVIHISNADGHWTTPLELNISSENGDFTIIKYKDDGFLIPVNILKVGQNIKIDGNFSGTVLDIKVK